MGGSSLGPEVIRRSFGEIPGRAAPAGARLDAPRRDRRRRRVDRYRQDLFIVSSKSGGTVETLSHYHHFRAKAGPEQFVVVTDPGSPLETLAADDGLRRTFLNTPDIGGRYSVLSYFGLVPAALMGVNVEALLHRCQVGEQNCAHYDSSQSNSGLWLGAVLGELARQGRDKLTFIVSPPIESFGLWVEQLIAESTGKQGRGMLPVADEPLGAPEDYGDDRVFIYLRNADEPDEELDEAVERSPTAGQPTLHAGHARRRSTWAGSSSWPSSRWRSPAGRWRSTPSTSPTSRRPRTPPSACSTPARVPEIEAASDEALRRCSRDAEPPHYVAVMGYLAPSDELDAAIAELRAAIRDKTRRGGHVRLRPALPALDRPAAQGRAADRPLPAARRRAPHRRGDPGLGLLVRDADRGPVGRRSADAARTRSARRAGQARGRHGRRGASAGRADHRAAAGSARVAQHSSAAHGDREPARRRARAAAGPSHLAGDLRGHRRPGAPQAAARRSTTSPTRARCPSASR